jgi:NAD(P)-dependent dehydrogenase (short-subunit alcohol dehydrogenase family)
MAPRLSGVAIVTGAASGMGKASAILFAKEGAHVACLDVNGDGMISAQAEITAAGGKAKTFVCDLTNPDTVEKTVKEIEDSMGHIKYLFNHAGGIVVKPFLETTHADWTFLMNVNVKKKKK